jgi:hypothetical protein
MDRQRGDAMKTAREVIVAVLADHLDKRIADEWADPTWVGPAARRRGGRPKSSVFKEIHIAWFIELERRKSGCMKKALWKAQEKFGLKKSRLRDIWNAHQSLFADVQ